MASGIFGVSIHNVNRILRQDHPVYSKITAEFAMQWVLQHLLKGDEPIPQLWEMIPSGNAKEAFQALRDALPDGAEGVKKVFQSLIKTEPYQWLRDLASKPLPISPETEVEEGPKERRYQLQPLSYFKNKPKRNWEVDQMVYDRGSSIFVGAHGSGKSTLVLDMFLSCACDVHFINKATKPAFLVWIAGESSDELYPRIAAFLACHDIPEDQLKNFLALDNCMPFNNVAEVQAFMEQVGEQLEEIGVTSETHSLVFVFDTYAKCTPGADENNTQETKAITASIDGICKMFNAHVSIIHHNNAQGKIRGNTALAASVDTVWNVSKEGDDMKLHCEKMRGTRTPDDFTVKMESIVLDPNNIGAPDSSAPVIFPSGAKAGKFTSKAHLQMLEVLKEHNQLTSGDWQKLCEEKHTISRPTFHRHVKQLTSNDLINAPAEEEREHGKKVYYSLSPKGVLLLG